MKGQKNLAPPGIEPRFLDILTRNCTNRSMGVRRKREGKEEGGH
jgi:hypothetical protein